MKGAKVTGPISRELLTGIDAEDPDAEQPDRTRNPFAALGDGKLTDQRAGAPWAASESPLPAVLVVAPEPVDRELADSLLRRVHALWQGRGVFDLALVAPPKGATKPYDIRPYAPRRAGDRFRVLRSPQPGDPKLIVISRAARRRLAESGPLRAVLRPEVPGIDTPVWGSTAAAARLCPCVNGG